MRLLTAKFLGAFMTGKKMLTYEEAAEKIGSIFSSVEKNSDRLKLSISVLAVVADLEETDLLIMKSSTDEIESVHAFGEKAKYIKDLLNVSNIDKEEKIK